jgi:hypothetical protein
VSGIDLETPHSLQWLFNVWRQDQAEVWRPVVNKLLAAMRERPDVILYPAALIFVSQTRDPVPEEDLFVDARAKAVLGEHTGAYYQLIQESRTPSGIAENHWARFRSAARTRRQASALAPSHQ